jgi:hypothetical protein
MKSVATVLYLSLVAMAAPAYAQSNAPVEMPEKVPAFSKLDVNIDGQISREEAQVDKRVAASFDKADKNRDGALSTQEYASIQS